MRGLSFSTGYSLVLHDFNAIKERLRHAVSLVDLVGEQVALKRAGRDLSGLCPFHQEKTPSFYVSPSKGIFKCFGCGAGGDIFTFVQLRERVEFREAMRILADRAGIELPTVRASAPTGEPSRADLAKVNAWAADFYRRQLLDDRCGAAARAYVSRRGINTDSCERFGMGVALSDGGQLLRAGRSAGISSTMLQAAGLIKAGDGGNLYDTFRDRLMFPIRDTMGRVVGFGGRALDDNPAKYLNTPQTSLFDKSRTVYGLDLARQAISATGRAVVVEGYIDCIAAHQAGVHETVATMGTALTELHADALRHYCGRLVLVFDSDAAGARAVDRAIVATVKYGLDVRIARVGEGKDPADFLQVRSIQEFSDLLNSGEDALGFKWRQVRAQAAGGANARDRHAAIWEFVRLVAGHCRSGAIDPIQRGLIVNQVAGLLALRPEVVQRQFEEVIQAGASAHRGSAGGQIAPAAAAQPSVRRPEETALRTALALVLREPGLWPRVRHVFDLDLIEDGRLRRVAQQTADLAERLGEFALTEVLAALEDPAEAGLVTDLAALTDERVVVDASATMADVVRRLEKLAADREARSATRAGRASTSGLDELRPGLALLQAAGLRQTQTFSPISRPAH